MTRPGNRLRALGVRWCSARTVERLIDPTLADMQVEHRDATEHGRAWLALAVRVQGASTCLRLIAAHAPVDALSAWTPDDREVAARVLRFAGGALVLVTLLLSMPVLSITSSASHANRARLVFLFALSGLPATVPVALMLGIVYGMGGRVVSRGLTVAALVLAIVCAAAMFGMAGWGIPATTQAFRAAAYPGRAEVRGANELTLGELADQMSSSPPFYARGRVGPRQLAAAYHLRWAVPCGALALAIWRCS